MITTSFDPRTFANMEVALQRACEQLPEDRKGHVYRRYVAQCIVDCATNESQSLTSLSQAGYRAVVEVCVGGRGAGDGAFRNSPHQQRGRQDVDANV